MGAGSLPGWSRILVVECSADGRQGPLRTPCGWTSRPAQAAASGITVVRTPVGAPRANALVERFLRSVRQECLDHLLLLSAAHLRRALREYVAYFNRDQPHQGRGQRLPVPSGPSEPARRDTGHIIIVPILGGLHHAYHRAA
jgi:putative transposase